MQDINDTRTIEELLKSITEKMDKISARQAEYEQQQSEFAEDIKNLQAELKKLQSDFNKINPPINLTEKKIRTEYKTKKEIDLAEIKKRQSNSKYDQLQRTLEDLRRSFYNSEIEEFFFTLWEDGITNFFGVEFDRIQDYFTIIDENRQLIRYGILLESSNTVALIEDLHSPNETDITSILNKIQIFRNNYTWYNNHKLYIGVATDYFYPKLEDICKEHGFAIIKKVEDTYVIYDDFIKAY
ncbi:MAG: hypothetical protein FWG98_10855 [Candidatus Cloacimonetes bacterium]|nr:hypothetical protein [Candidatus Cloacimonadota bacterium]